MAVTAETLMVHYGMEMQKRLDKVKQAFQPVALSSLSFLTNDLPSEQAQLLYGRELVLSIIKINNSAMYNSIPLHYNFV